jgi:hypothetical protein
MFGQLLIVLGNLEHRLSGFRVGHFLGMSARFLGALAPVFWIVEGTLAISAFFEALRGESKVVAKTLKCPKLAAIILALNGHGEWTSRSNPPLSGIQRAFAFHRAVMPAS